MLVIWNHDNDSACYTNSLSQVSSPYSYNVIRMFGKGLNDVAMTALDWPAIWYFKSLFFANFTICAYLIHSAMASSNPSISEADVRFAEEKCTFFFFPLRVPFTFIPEDDLGFAL